MPNDIKEFILLALWVLEKNISLTFRKITSARENFIITATEKEMKARISQQIASVGSFYG